MVKSILKNPFKLPEKDTDDDNKSSSKELNMGQKSAVDKLDNFLQHADDNNKSSFKEKTVDRKSAVDNLDNLLQHPMLKKLLSENERAGSSSSQSNEEQLVYEKKEFEKGPTREMDLEEIRARTEKAKEVILRNRSQKMKMSYDKKALNRLKKSITDLTNPITSSPTSSQTDYKHENQPKDQGATLSHALAPEYFKMAICLNDYPKSKLSEEQCLLLKKSIVDSMIVHQMQGGLPRFEDSFLDKGIFVTICSDMDTKNWLQSIIPQLKPWVGAKLNINEYHKITSSVEVEFRVPKEFNNSEPIMIFILVEGQNPGIDVKEWTVVGSEYSNSLGRLIKAAIDNQSWNYIKKCGYHLNLGLGKIMVTQVSKQYNED